MFSELLATVKVPDDLVVTADLVLTAPTKSQLSDLQVAQLSRDEELAQKIIFGEQYDAAKKLFDDKPAGIWNAFMERYNEHFFGDGDAGK